MSNDDGKPKPNQGIGAYGVPPGGVRLPDAVRDLAINKVEECVLKGMRASQILPIMAELNATESIRTVQDWIAEVRQRLLEADLEQRDFRRNLRRAQLESRYQMALADLNEARALAPSAAKVMALAMLHRSVATIEQLMMKIDGLEGPLKIEHSGTIDVRAMSPDQRRERITHLLAKREAAMKAIAPPTGSN